MLLSVRSKKKLKREFVMAQNPMTYFVPYFYVAMHFHRDTITNRPV